MENRLLAAVPDRQRRHLLRSGERVRLEMGQVLAVPGAPVDYVYFPLESYVTLVAPLDDGTIQVGMVGNEGLVGVSLVLGVATSSLKALVQGGGLAVRIGAWAFQQELARSPVLRRTLHRYFCVLVAQLAQNTGCARFHRVEARLARWLLVTRDCAHDNRFFITHELLSGMLGVRRVGVTNAASALQAANLIHYQRGNVTIVNHGALMTAACECYRRAQRLYEDLLGPVPGQSPASQLAAKNLRKAGGRLPGATSASPAG
ncbi:MAG: Crp/Fnr family transcriptional regulator [Gammaproteobacteria bacterium]|jgi:CRP-like cAMP-binding protein|nr:Crp/Fnr family transcriptional regulator [Gammaproteobacteria bacterium]